MIETYINNFISKILSIYLPIYNENNIKNGIIGEFCITIDLPYFEIKDKVGDNIIFEVINNQIKIVHCTLSENRLKYTLRYLSENWIPLQPMLES